MPKKNDMSDEGDWDSCPVCGRSVKAKNLDRHLAKVHSDLSKKEIKEKMKSQKGRVKRGSSGQKRSDLRKELVRERKKRQDIIFVVSVIIIGIVGIGGYYLYDSMTKSDDNNDEWTWEKPPEPAQQSPGTNNPGSGNKNEIRIPKSEVSDGKAHYYTYDSNGIKIRYFLLRSSDGVTRAAFDTCDVCYDAKKGYHQEGDEMVCNNCGQRFPSEKINVEKGGCNPAPLNRKTEGDDVVIQINDIESGRWYFI